MIFTNPGAALASLSVGGEDHLDGWTFTLTGNGKHDHLFTIVDNKLLVGIQYVYPGNKEIEVQYVNSLGAGRVMTMPVIIKDYAAELDPDNHLSIDVDELPVPTGRVWTTMSWYNEDVSSEFPLVTVDNNVVVKIDVTGALKIYNPGGGQVYTSNLVKFVPRRWHTLVIERIEQGAGHIWRYSVGEEVLFESPDATNLDDVKDYGMDFLKRNGVGSGNLYMTNVKFIHENIVYIREELHLGAGELIESSADITYNHLKQQV